MLSSQFFGDSVSINSDAAKITEVEMQKCADLMEKYNQHPKIILDFCESREMTTKARKLLLAKGAFHKAQGKTLIFMLSESIQKQFEGTDIDSIFQCVVQHPEVMDSVEVTHENDTQELFQVMVGHVLHQLKISAGIDAVAGAPFKKEATASTDFDFAGMVEVDSTAFQGVMMLKFHRAILEDIIQRIFRDPQAATEEKNLSWAAECLNGAIGKAKAQLNGRGFKISDPRPQLIRSGEANHFQTHDDSIVIPFSYESGDFHIELVPRGIS